MNIFKTEIALSVAIVILLALNVYSFEFMANKNVLLVDVFLVAVFLAAFVGLYFKEKSQDEREAQNVMLADRFGYLVGIVALVLAIIFQYFFTQTFSSVLLVVLCLMILAKLAGWVFGQIKN